MSSTSQSNALGEATHPARIFEGGRIFALFVLLGGVMTCWGAIRRWVFFVVRTPDGGDEVQWLRPITGPSPGLARQALVAGLLILVCALGFIILRRDSIRLALMTLALLVGVWITRTFNGSEVEDPLSLVPVGLRRGLSLCPLPPCIEVLPIPEWIQWGAMMAIFWGALAMGRALALMLFRRRGVASTDPARSLVSDSHLFLWLLAATLVIAAVLYAGFIILYGMFAGDRGA